MYDIEITKLVLKNKKEELDNLSNNNQSNKTEIDALKKEIRNLESYLNRYRLAEILKLHKDNDYINSNFIGIELENPDDYDLTPEERTEYDSIISKIPKLETSIYKHRRSIATILKKEDSQELRKVNYQGIEKTNPDLIRYNISDEELKKFKDTIKKINAMLAYSNETNVDIEKEAIKVLKETFDALNIEDKATYESIKEEYLNTIDLIMTHTSKEATSSALSETSLNNYDLGLELSKKYPALKPKMTMDTLKRLFREVENGNLSEQKTKDYLEYLCIKINELYQDENNRAEIESLLNSISNKIELKYELSVRVTSVNNVNLNLTDEEIKTVFKHLDENYNHLDEERREKYYQIVSSFISKNINDVDKAEEINKLLLGIKNKEFEERLQKQFKEQNYAKFSRGHISNQEVLIEEQIKKLEELKKSLEKNNKKIEFFDDRNEIRIATIDKEIEKLKKLKLKYDKNKVVNKLDEVYNKKTDKIIEIDKDIKKLSETKADIKSKYVQRLIDKKIKSKQAKVNKLQKSKVDILKNQRKIMAPKLFVERKKELIKRRLEARQELFDSKEKGYELLSDKEQDLNEMFSGIKAAFYEYKSGRYQTKRERNEKIYEILYNSEIQITGANEIDIDVEVVDALRQQRLRQQTI